MTSRGRERWSGERQRLQGGCAPGSGGVRGAIVLALLLPACTSEAGGFVPECQIVQAEIPLASGLRETSGVAVSARDPGVLWTVLDSGGGPDLYAIDATGKRLGRVRVQGAANLDWEDLSQAPCASGSCLYIADIGDNGAERASIALYRVPEPDPGDRTTARAERFEARYPDGPRNAEALLVLPGEEVLIISKGDTGPIALYRYPGQLRSGEGAVELERIRLMSTGPVPLGDQVTGADVRPDGRWIVVRSYRELLFYDRAEFLDPEVQPNPVRIDLAPAGEPQGEGVGFGPEGAIVLTSEGFERGAPGSMALLRCVLDEEEAGAAAGRSAPARAGV